MAEITAPQPQHRGGKGAHALALTLRRRAGTLASWLLVGLIVAYGAGVLIVVAQPAHVQQDLQVYYYAARAWLAGLDPYDNAVLSVLAGRVIELPFVYPPFTLPLFVPLAQLSEPTAAALWVILKGALLAGLLALWRVHFAPPDARMAHLLLFCLLAYNTALFVDFSTGNTTVLEQAAIWVGLFFLLAGRPALFCLCIVLASAFKVTPLLLLPLLWLGRGRHRTLHLALALLAYALVSAAAARAAPALFQGFLRNLLVQGANAGERGAVNPCSLALAQDLARLLTGRSSGLWPYLLYALPAIAVLWTTIRALRRLSRAAPTAGRARIALYLALCAYALILPRFKVYAYILLLIPTGYLALHPGIAKPAGAFAYLLPLIGLPGARIPLLPGLGPMQHYVAEYLPLLVATLTWALYVRACWRVEAAASPAPSSVAPHRPPGDDSATAVGP